VGVAPPELPPIDWRVHLKSTPEAAYDMWTTDQGRARFWAERSIEQPGGFTLHFVNGQSLDVELVEAVRPNRMVFRYFGGSKVTVTFDDDGKGGCDLHLVEQDCPVADHLENHAGWVSVLLAFKASADLGVDLRSHDPARSWDKRFVDN
jgi:uncharacterized protein YndB with AHSA1/START domain